MPHEVTTGKHPDIVVVRYHGEIESADIITDPEELHLDQGRPKYLLADVGSAQPVVPENMWERLHASIINHPNLAHIAIYVRSAMLRVLMNVIVKLTRQRSRVSLHESFDEAEAHLLNLIKEAALQKPAR